MGASTRKRYVEEEAALRRVSASLSGDMTKLAERLLLVVQGEPGTPDANRALQDKLVVEREKERRPWYVLVSISGSKPKRFQENTTLPTFLDWNMPCVCRVPKHVVDIARTIAKGNTELLEKHICLQFGRPLQQALAQEQGSDAVVLSVGTSQDDNSRDPSQTYLDITLVHMDLSGFETDDYHHGRLTPLQSKRFFYKRFVKGDPVVSWGDAKTDADSDQRFSTLVEVTVAHPFPCVLSRQRTLLTSEILPTHHF
jgi:hypothetical protein